MSVLFIMIFPRSNSVFGTKRTLIIVKSTTYLIVNFKTSIIKRKKKSFRYIWMYRFNLKEQLSKHCALFLSVNLFYVGLY